MNLDAEALDESHDMIDTIGLAIILFLQPLIGVLWLFIVIYGASKVASRKSGQWVDARLETAREQVEDLK